MIKPQNLLPNLSPRQPLEDEYISETDGLIYCSKCHTPRQKKIEFLGKIMFPIIRCQCQQEQYEKEEAKRKHQEFLEIEKAKNYVTHWEEIKSKAMGLLLWGDVGTGKSFFAGCVANALLDKGVPVLMTNFAKILNSLTGIYPQDRNEFINSLNQYSLLIIDDLGVERNSEFALEQVFHVIDSRYRSMKPMIITTNLTLEELKHPEDLAHSRIYDRILERCVPLKINNQNIRELNAVANMSEARKLLA